MCQSIHVCPYVAFLSLCSWGGEEFKYMLKFMKLYMSYNNNTWGCKNEVIKMTDSLCHFRFKWMNKSSYLVEGKSLYIFSSFIASPTHHHKTSVLTNLCPSIIISLHICRQKRCVKPTIYYNLLCTQILVSIATTFITTTIHQPRHPLCFGRGCKRKEVYMQLH